jgi:hypothetical protein
MITCLCRWLPTADLTVVGDSSYSVIEPGPVCRHRGLLLIASLRLDARLLTPAPVRSPGTVGRHRVAGDRLTNLDVVLADPETTWSRVMVTNAAPGCGVVRVHRPGLNADAWPSGEGRPGAAGPVAPGVPWGE